MKYLAIDFGNKRTGLAICDASETISSPFKVLKTGPNMISEIAAIIHSEEIEEVVVGLPLNMDDSEGFQAKAVRKFADRLQKYIDITIHFQDERLSSFAAEQKLIGAELTRKKKKGILDAVAAAEILNSFIEHHGEQGGDPLLLSQ